ncbi:MAG: sensor histidine kinase [Chloroflexota bacterium]|nr:MAG: sensor histidine kinase [Chloroflexota bacterium]
MPFHLPFTGLRAKLIIFAFAILLPVAGLVAYDFQQDARRHIQNELDDQLQAARAMALVADEAFDGATSMAAALAKMPTFQRLDRTAITASLAHLLSQNPQYYSLLVYDRSGVNVAAAFAEEGESVPTVTDQPYFQSIVQTGQPSVSEVRMHNPTEQPIVLVGVPIKNPEDQIVGAMLTGLTFDELTGKIAHVGLQPPRDVFLADPTGRVGLHSGRTDLTWEERKIAEWAPFANALRGELVRMAEVRSPFLGDIRAVAAVRSARYGWVAGVSESNERLMAPVWESLREHLIWYLPTLGFALVLAIMVSGVLTSPIRELATAFSDVQAGLLGRRVTLRTSDEVEALGQSFNRTVEQMERMAHERAEFDRLREEFISMVAHDLRTPLMAIVGWSELLGRSLGGRSELDREQKAVEHLRSSARRLDAMIGDLLDASRIETNRLQLEKEPVDLGRLVPDVVERLAEVTRGHPVLVTETVAGLITQADPRRIEQVLGNLLSNAAKYGYPTTEIIVRVWAQEGQVCCSVSNQGQGISPEELERLFERYYRAGRPRAATGLGLGLYITKGLIDAHGGQIWMASEVGKGATCTFCLPRS